MIGVIKMVPAKNTQTKRNHTRKKGASFRQILRVSFFLVIGLLIVYIYYLMTEDKLLSQIVKLSSIFVTFIKSIPMPVFFIIGYTILVFYVGYLVGKKRQ
jgi:hypothetical protein